MRKGHQGRGKRARRECIVKAAVWFEAQGRSAYSRGLPLNYGRALRVYLPMWCRQAWARGWLSQGQQHTRSAA